MLTRTGKFTAIGLVLVGALASGVAPAAAADRAAALKRELGPGVRVAEHRGTGLVRFVGTSAGRPIARPSGLSASAAPSAAARAFLGRHGDAFGIRDSRPAHDRDRPRHRRALDGPLPAAARRRARAWAASSSSASTPSATCCRRAARRWRTDVATTPAVGAGAARDAAVTAVARGEGVSAFQLAAELPELAIYDAGLLGGPGPEPASLVWRLEVTSRSASADRPARPRRRPARHGGAHDRPDRAREGPHRLRRGQRERPGPVHRADRHRSGPARGRGPCRRRPCLRVRRGHLRLLRRPRPRQPRRQRHDAQVDRPVLRSRADVPVSRTRSGTASRWSTARATRRRTTSSGTS